MLTIIQRTGEVTEIEATLKAHVERMAAAFTGQEAAPIHGAGFTAKNAAKGEG